MGCTKSESQQTHITRAWETAKLSLLEHSITSGYRNSQLTHDLRYANDRAKGITLRKIQRNDHRVAGVDM